MVRIYSRSRSKKFGQNETIPPAILSWSKLSYEVDLPRKRGQAIVRKRLLDEVYGYVKPGQLVALMGSSGAGKSTLMDVIAQRKTGGYITGSVKLNGMDTDSNFVSVAG